MTRFFGRQTEIERQQAFIALLVFHGGWTLNAAEWVAGGSMLNLHLQLQEHSLIVTREHGGEIRYGMMETLREYAQEQLTGQERNSYLRRHRDFYLALAEEARRPASGPAQIAWHERIERELDNLRAGLRYCQQEAD